MVMNISGRIEQPEGQNIKGGGGGLHNERITQQIVQESSCVS